MTVKRIDKPVAAPITQAEMIERAAWMIIDDLAQTFYWTQFAMGRPVNTMDVPYRSSTTGGQVTQMGSKGFFRLADDEAMVVTAGLGGAAYASMVLHDCFYRTVSYPTHTSSLNNAQVVPNPDGTVTYVVSIKDPGVHNWVDTAGLHDLIINHRWHGLSRDPAARNPTISLKLVKLRNLRDALPAGMRTMTAAEREQQLRQRQAGYLRRIAET